MRKLLSLLLITAAALAWADEAIPVQTKITDVTVYQSKATVTRSGRFTVPAGQSTLVIKELPSKLDDNSIRVGSIGSADFTILNVNSKFHYDSEDPVENVETLRSVRDSLDLKISVIDNQLTVIESQLKLLAAFQSKADTQIPRELATQMNVATYKEALNFLGDNLTSLYARRLKLQQQRILIKSELKEIIDILARSAGRPSRISKEIAVTIDAPRRGQYLVELSYLISDAGWQSSYDARYNLDARKMLWQYYADVQQSTGESWEDVNLSLSTVDPSMSKALPELGTWELTSLDPARKISSGKLPYNLEYREDPNIPSGRSLVTGVLVDAETMAPLFGANILYRGTSLGCATDRNGAFNLNIPAGKGTLTIQFMGYAKLNIDINPKSHWHISGHIKLSQNCLEGEAVTIVAERPLLHRLSADDLEVQPPPVPEEEYAQKQVVAMAQSTQHMSTYVIRHVCTVPDDNEAHRMTIGANEYPFELATTTLPKLDAHAYMTGRFVNDSELTMLPGQVNVFVDNQFMHQSSTFTILPQDTVQRSLGHDPRIEVERKLIRQDTDKEGFLKGKQVKTFEYDIKITNKRMNECEIKVVDQVPVSTDKHIEVEVLTPAPEEMKPDKEGRLEWQLTLKPQESQTLTLKFKVSCPKDKVIVGL